MLFSRSECVNHYLFGGMHGGETLEYPPASPCGTWLMAHKSRRKPRVRRNPDLSYGPWLNPQIGRYLEIGDAAIRGQVPSKAKYDGTPDRKRCFAARQH